MLKIAPYRATHSASVSLLLQYDALVIVVRGLLAESAESSFESGLCSCVLATQHSVFFDTHSNVFCVYLSCDTASSLPQLLVLS